VWRVSSLPERAARDCRLPSPTGHDQCGGNRPDAALGCRTLWP
jgi:hypothetical protein